MAKIETPKTRTTHPRTGTQFNIDSKIYEAIKTAILQSLKTGKGKHFSVLTEEVSKIIRKKMPGFKRSIPWYTISVRLDLESRGIVETYIEKGKKLNRLVQPVSEKRNK